MTCSIVALDGSDPYVKLLANGQMAPRSLLNFSRRFGCIQSFFFGLGGDTGTFLKIVVYRVINLQDSPPKPNLTKKLNLLYWVLRVRSVFSKARPQQRLFHSVSWLSQTRGLIARQFAVYTFGQQPAWKYTSVFKFLIFRKIRLELTNLFSCGHRYSKNGSEKDITGGITKKDKFMKESRGSKKKTRSKTYLYNVFPTLLDSDTNFLTTMNTWLKWEAMKAGEKVPRASLNIINTTSFPICLFLAI